MSGASALFCHAPVRRCWLAHRVRGDRAGTETSSPGGPLAFVQGEICKLDLEALMSHASVLVRWACQIRLTIVVGVVPKVGDDGGHSVRLRPADAPLTLHQEKA
jgi:hypothetical protein